jgi:hypothetical protein
LFFYSGCDPEPGMDINFSSSTVIYSNLGGAGPNKNDPRIIRYENIGIYQGKKIHLEISVKNRKRFSNLLQNKNGYTGNVGRISVWEKAKINAVSATLIYTIVFSRNVN